LCFDVAQAENRMVPGFFYTFFSISNFLDTSQMVVLNHPTLAIGDRSAWRCFRAAAHIDFL